MPPAFNLSQDQTLQFNPIAPAPEEASYSLKAISKDKEITTREHF
jgi:hypothetical protein